MCVTVPKALTASITSFEVHFIFLKFHISQVKSKTFFIRTFVTVKG